MKTRIIIAAILAFILFPIRLSAQSNECLPGIYTVVNGKHIPLKYTYGGSNTRHGLIIECNELSSFFFQYKGETSNVIASDTLVYVKDLSNNHTYYPFNKWMNPNSMIVIPLTVNNGYREYNMEDDIPREDFDWEKLDEAIFQIKLTSLTPGEYGVVFQKGKFGPLDYTRIHCFTISKP